MSVPAVKPTDDDTPPTQADVLSATNQSPSVAPNTPPKYKSSGIAIKLSYNQPQSSQEKPNEPESGKQFSQVLSVPNPLEKPTIAHSRSVPTLTEVKKKNLPATTGQYSVFL